MAGFSYITRQAVTGSNRDFFLRNILTTRCGCGSCGDCAGDSSTIPIVDEAYGDLCPWPDYGDVATWATSEGVEGSYGRDGTINSEALAWALDATISKICRDSQSFTRYLIDSTTGELDLDADGNKQVASIPGDVRLATVMMATRLYRRRLSPDGTLGASAFGGAVRVGKYDPDIEALLAPYMRPGFSA